MSNYKYPTPQLLFKAICNKIRDKTNSNELINHQDIPDKIDNLVDSDIINEYNELLSMIIGSNSTKINTDKIENLRIKFMENRNLTTVNLPECTSIGTSAFRYCTGLTTIDLPKCTSIGSGAFSYCTSLTTIDLPKCTSIGSGAFNNCTNLTTIDLPECIVINGSPHFSGATIDCTNLTTINLPKCTSIGSYAFYGSGLTTVILSSNQVVTLEGINAFNSYSIRIYVPDDLVDSYKTATNWSTYVNQIKPLSELPSNLKEEYGYD